MKKPGALLSALRDSGANVAAAPAPAPVQAEPTPPPAPDDRPAARGASPAARPAKAAVPPSRANTKPITAHHPEAVRRQLKMLAAEQGRTMDDLLAEALNLVFAKYRKPEIARQKTPTT